MTTQRIVWPNLTEGISTGAPDKRPPGSVTSAVNTQMRKHRGLEKRDGTSLILAADTVGGELNVTNPTNPKYVHWIDRDDDERFIMLIDPANSGTDRCEVFTLVDRSPESAGDKMTVADANSVLDYLDGGSLAAHIRYSSTTLADTTILLNRTATLALTGAARTYKDGSGGNIRNKSNTNNVTSWSTLPQPPISTISVTDGIPSTDNSVAIYYAQDDDLGWPSGWYAATSTNQAPWYQRIVTEGSNSQIDAGTVPIRVDFDGTQFAVSTPKWTPRFSGDSFTNPGPNLLSRPFGTPTKAADLAFFQSRMWLAGDEFVDSSQTGDFFNLWQQSQALLVDSDPVAVQTQSDSITTVDWLVPTDYGILAMTRGNRQFFIASQGAMSPTSASVLPAGSYHSVPYIRPAKMGSSVYFGSEQNLSNTIWEYRYDPNQGTSLASELTTTVEGFIPKAVRNIRVSEQNQMLLVTTDGDPSSIYVCQMSFDSGQRSQTAWFKWELECDSIVDINVIQSNLFIVLRRGSKIWLETVNLDTPSNDTDAYTYVSGDMGFSVRLDQKLRSSDITTTYDAIAGTTTWTIPHENHPVDSVVLGQGFDVDWSGGAQRWRGRVLKDTLTIDRTAAGTTTVTTVGNYTQNLNGDPAGVWLGKSFEMRVEMNEPYVGGGQEGTQYGVMQIRTGMLRISQTGAFRIEVTPYDRATVTTEYITIDVGQYLLGESLILADDEVHFNVLGASHNTKVELVNDSPYPSRFDSLEYVVTFNPYKRDPSRGASRG